MDKLSELLKKYKSLFGPVLPIVLSDQNTFWLDLGESNTELSDLDIADNEVFNLYLDHLKLKNRGRIPVGGYNEKRVLYSRSDHFGSGSDKRDIHLGIDIWVEAGTPLSAPLDSVVHSYANNINYRDYGPAIILEHQLEGVRFHSLYGHLSPGSLDMVSKGNIIRKGEVFASVGTTDSNGSWPPHLHFQLVHKTDNWKGDYPGVASETELSFYLNNCPDPSPVLGL